MLQLFSDVHSRCRPMNASRVFYAYLMFSCLYVVCLLCVLYMILHYVQEALSGRAHTTMLATISPSSNNYVETMNTLKYAERLRRASVHLNWNKDANGPPVGKVSPNTSENRRVDIGAHIRASADRKLYGTPRSKYYFKRLRPFVNEPWRCRRNLITCCWPILARSPRAVFISIVRYAYRCAVLLDKMFYSMSTTMLFSTSLFSAPAARCGIVCDHRHFPPFSSPSPPPFRRRLNWCWSGYSAVGLYERGNGKTCQEAGSRRRRGQETGKSGKTGRATYETCRLFYFASGHCFVVLSR